MMLRKVLFGAGMILWASGNAWAAPRCMPFAGERMVFSVGWEFIKAGTASMDVQAGTADTYSIKTEARSNAFFDIFKRVRDTITSKGLCQNTQMQSTAFDIEQHERRYTSKKSVRFLWQKNQVSFTQNDHTDIYQVPAGHLNAVDAFFALRAMKLKVGDTVRIPLFDSRKRYQLDVHVLKKVRIHAPWGENVDALVIEPKLKTKAIFSSKGKMKIWLTDDARHIPLKMTAKIKIGHIVAILRSYTPPHGS